MRLDNALKLTITLALFICLFFLTRASFVSADNEVAPNNLQSLLERLKQQIIESREFTVTFEFHSPLIKGDDVWWSVPYFDQDSELTRDLGEIGTDYVCFNERWGDQDLFRCTPFSNIAAVVYTDSSS